jgi:hypothetical protein
MKPQPTYDDANLILKLYELRREERLRAARKWLAGLATPATVDELLQSYPPGSDENAYFRMVITYWEMAASFVASGILNRELFFRSNNQELLYVWEKVKALVPQYRERSKNPMMYSNLEKVAGWFIEFLDENAPEAYATLSGNIAKTIAAARHKK